MDFLEIVWPPPEATSHFPEIDIVFIHGLNPLGSANHAYNTWTHSNGICWPKALLAEEIPWARIMIFSYNSSVAFNATNGDVRSHAAMLLNRLKSVRKGGNENSPIIFVCHSLGGIVVKQALCRAVVDKRYASLRKSTFGLMFFGTPHRGGNKAETAQLLANIVSVFTGEPRNNLLSTLKRNSLYNEAITDDFTAQVNSYEIISFYEGRKTDVKIHNWRLVPQVTSMFVVDREVARLGSEREETLRIDASHSDMCKFSGEPHDGKFQIVKDNLKEMADKARKKHAPKALNTRYIFLDRKPNKFFVGRENIIQQLEKSLTGDGPINCAVLYGLGGVGKTHIALKYCHKKITESSNISVFWIDASSEVKIRDACKGIASKARIPGRDDQTVDILVTVQSWLKSEKGGEWILVFDNFDSRNETLFLLQRFLDSGPTTESRQLNRLALFTSRNKALAVELSTTGDLIRVPTMEKIEAEKLAKKWLERDKFRSEILLSGVSKESSSISQLVDAINCIPLAIEQACAYILRTPVSLETYIDILRRRAREIDNFIISNCLSEESENAYHQRGIFYTWRISFDHIQNENVLAADIMRFLAFLDSQKIPLRLLEKRFNDSAQLRNALAIISDFSFLTFQDAAYFQMHRLVQVATQYWLSDNEKSEWGDQVLDIVYEEVPELQDQKWNQENNCMYHADAVLEHEPRDPSHQLTRSSLQIKVAFHLLMQIQVKSSERHAERAHATRKKLLGDHLDCAKSADLLGLIYQRQGKLEKAEEVMRFALETKKKFLSYEHKENLKSLDFLAKILIDRAKFKAAEGLYQDAFATCGKLLEKNDSRLLALQRGLASAALSGGDVEQARFLYQSILNVRRETLPEDHDDVLETLEDMAELLNSHEDYTGAENIYRATSNIRDAKASVEGESFDNIVTMLKLASCLLCNQKYQESEEVARTLLQRSEKFLGPNHPVTFSCLTSLASSLQLQGKDQQAQALLKQAIDGLDKCEAANVPEALLTSGIYASVLCSQGKAQDAEEIFVKILKKQEELLGTDHPHTLMMMHNLGLCKMAQQKPREARYLYSKAWEARKRIFGDKNPQTLESLHHIGWAFSMEGQYENAEKSFRQASEGRTEILGPMNPATIHSTTSLAQSLEMQGELKEAEALYRTSLKRRELLLGRDNAFTQSLASSLARNLQSQGILEDASEILKDYSSQEPKAGAQNEILNDLNDRAYILLSKGQLLEAKATYEMAYRLNMEEKGEYHPVTLKSRHGLGNILKLQGNYEVAEDHTRKLLSDQQTHLDPRHYSIWDSQQLLAEILSTQGHLEEAEGIYRDVLKKVASAHGKGHPFTVVSTDDLCDVLSSLHKFEEAERLQRQNLEDGAKILGEDSRILLLPRFHLACLLSVRGKLDEAESLLRRSLADCTTAFGSESVFTLENLENLADVLSKQSRYSEAKTLYITALETSRKVLPLDHDMTLRIQQALLIVTEAM